MLTVRETAERLGLRECTIRAWLSARKISFVRLGRAVRIPESEVSRLIETNTVPRREPRRGCAA
jgi:excisionase family DNA binding protein